LPESRPRPQPGPPTAWRQMPALHVPVEYLSIREDPCRDPYRHPARDHSGVPSPYRASAWRLSVVPLLPIAAPLAVRSLEGTASGVALSSVRSSESFSAYRNTFPSNHSNIASVRAFPRRQPPSTAGLRWLRRAHYQRHALLFRPAAANIAHGLFHLRTNLHGQASASPSALPQQ
jgi:hypothetical protein